MEASVQAALQEAYETDANLQGECRIAGLVVADNRGLCIQAQGAGQPESAGLLAAVASQAALLEPGEQPVVLLEAKDHNYLVKKEDNVTVAIIKNKT